MMMIAARGEEQRSGIVPHHAVEAETLRVERSGPFQVAHVQVDMTHRRCGRHRGPRHVARSVEQSGDIDRIGGHHQLPPDPPPGAPRPVGVHFDTEVVGILEIERLAHEVIRRAYSRADLTDMPEKAAQRGAVRQQYGEVVETHPATARCRPHARPLPKLDQRRIDALRREERTGRFALQRS